MDNTRLLEKDIAAKFETIRISDQKAYFTDISDLHIGHKGFDEQSLEQLIKIIKKTPNFYIFIGGDSTNHANKGSKSSQYEEYMSPRCQIKGLYENGKLIRKGLKQFFEPISDRIIGAIDGNHDGTRLREFNDMSATEYFCDISGVKFFGEFAFIEFIVNRNSYTHFIHHSGSKGKKQNLNALQDRALNFNADVHWGEHTHKDLYGRDVVIDFDRKNKKPIVRDRLYINSSSYLSWSGYAVRKLYSPNKTGVKIIEMSGKRDEWDIRVYERLKDFEVI